MEPRFLVGIIGSFVLLSGYAVPARRVSHPARSTKNRMFAIGNAFMFAYSLMGYLGGGTLFFLFLQTFIAASTVLMMFNTPDRIDTPILGLVGVGLVAWALTLFTGFGTIVFVAGLVILGLGFAFENGTVRRNIAVTIGSACIAYFSFLVEDWVFFYLNTIITVVSLYHVSYVLKAQKSQKEG